MQKCVYFQGDVLKICVDNVRVELPQMAGMAVAGIGFVRLANCLRLHLHH